MYERLIEARRRHSNEDGFTLIELLIVIVILGILAAIVVFSVAGITDKGTTNACKTSVETVDTAYEAYVANLPDGTAVPATSAVTLSQLKPNFLHSIPTTIGTNAVTGATKVSEVDGFTC